MTEREMVEAAARAVGLDAAWSQFGMWLRGAKGPDGDGYWDPRGNDGDALRLAAALRISVEHNHPEQEHNPWVLATVEGPNGVVQVIEDVPDESQRADRMRLAILRCAAAQAPKEGV